uniref:Neurotrypsin n=1 Tax=Podarcis muralis TaxID=64176 RepID=A0A670HU34_PODMU
QPPLYLESLIPSDRLPICCSAVFCSQRQLKPSFSFSLLLPVSGACEMEPLGYYNGSLSVTLSGSACLNWLDFPDYVHQYPNRGLGNHSYCRNPEGGATPWCFYQLASGAIGWANCDCSQGSPLRLVGGKKSFEGRVEVYHGGLWGTICDDQWDDKDAEVICRQLGFSGSPKAVSWAQFGQGLGPILLDEVECSGNELSLDQCKKSSWEEHNCDHIEDAGVICDPFAEGTIRLAGGHKPNEGRVEVYHNGSWGCVCDDGWTGINAQVACRQLGFSGPAQLAAEGEFASGQGFILLDDVACTGSELSLFDCPHSNWGQHDCSHEEDVGVHCSPDSNRITEEATGIPVRLVDGNGTKEGRVEVFLNGQWGSVCDHGWTDRDAAVVCKQLGYSGTAKAKSMAYLAEGHAPIHLDKVECSGTEHTLGECVTRKSNIHSCWKDAGVICDYIEEEEGEPGKHKCLIFGMCGRRLLHHRKKRIIGGNKSLRGGWPWQVSLRLKGFHRDARLLCGATLISNCWVLTAAHCFKRFGVDVRRYLLRVGDHHTGVRDEFERELPVEKIVLHRNYQSSSNDNDIALVRIRGKSGNCLSFSHHVLPVCLPERKEKSSIDRQACVISGWGDTGRSYSRTLLQGSVPLLPRRVCKSRYGKKFTNRMLCAGNISEDNRVDSCQGDSGGPLMCQRSGGHWVILGITSWGYGCGRKDSPGVYTKVSKFVPWIKKVTKLI